MYVYYRGGRVGCTTIDEMWAESYVMSSVLVKAEVYTAWVVRLSQLLNSITD